MLTNLGTLLSYVAAALGALEGYGHGDTAYTKGLQYVINELMREYEANKQPVVEQDAALEALKTIRSCVETYLSENTAHELKNRLDRVEAYLKRESEPFPAAHENGLQEDARRYRFLRSRDLNTIKRGGIFAGKVPENIVLNELDLDAEIDVAMIGENK